PDDLAGRDGEADAVERAEAAEAARDAIEGKQRGHDARPRGSEHSARAPSPPSSGGEGWGDGVHPRVTTIIVLMERAPHRDPLPARAGRGSAGALPIHATAPRSRSA